MRDIDMIRSRQQLEEMPIRTLNRNCSVNGYRVELWKYKHKRNKASDYKYRNIIILHKEV